MIGCEGLLRFSREMVAGLGWRRWLICRRSPRSSADPTDAGRRMTAARVTGEESLLHSHCVFDRVFPWWPMVY
ncbi:putative vegetative cell wall protein gp1-like isoform X5 [Iris pallida]|uniref:Vegetative cell wall protein gp1-like isoform X5 n=1 Tax=Iris pallida TaxID=29817 RepID=A0AAX6HGI0_IRIPA|nr:putative vegetative cell wall protein gp1-like isoform X5 [Iris pallida]